MNFDNYVVHITTQTKDDDLNHPLNNFSSSKSSGTGFYIDHGIILTCYHVIQNSLKILVKTYNKNNEIFDNKAIVKYIFPDDDLAVIEVENKNILCNIFEYYILTKKINNLEVNTVGFPLNSTTLKINKGVISGYQDSNIQTDSTLNSGNSGGPLLYNNKVIGINQSKLIGSASNTGFAVPIFRFLILYKLKSNQLKLVNNKPTLLFRFQKNKQKFNNFEYGVRISELHNNSCLHKYDINVNDIILKINGNKIDSEGKIKFPFFPEKINLEDLKYWFTVDDKITFTYYSNKENKIIDKVIDLIFFETNLLNYYKELNRKYIFENNGLVFSVFTNYHVNEMKYLEISLIKKIKLLSRFLSINDIFTVYLSDLIYSKLKFTEYPLNEIITHINDIKIIDYDTLVKVMQTPVTKIKTIDNDIFYIN
jgi:S1-C subfamily serine protease